MALYWEVPLCYTFSPHLQPVSYGPTFNFSLMDASDGAHCTRKCYSAVFSGLAFTASGNTPQLALQFSQPSTSAGYP